MPGKQSHTRGVRPNHAQQKPREPQHHRGGSSRSPGDATFPRVGSSPSAESISQSTGTLRAHGLPQPRRPQAPHRTDGKGLTAAGHCRCLRGRLARADGSSSPCTLRTGPRVGHRHRPGTPRTETRCPQRKRFSLPAGVPRFPRSAPRTDKPGTAAPPPAPATAPTPTAPQLRRARLRPEVRSRPAPTSQPAGPDRRYLPVPSVRAGAAAAHGRRPCAPQDQRLLRGPLRPWAGWHRRAAAPAALGSVRSARRGWAAAGAAGRGAGRPRCPRRREGAQRRLPPPPRYRRRAPGRPPGSAPAARPDGPARLCGNGAAPSQLSPLLITGAVRSGQSESELISPTYPPSSPHKRRTKPNPWGGPGVALQSAGLRRAAARNKSQPLSASAAPHLVQHRKLFFLGKAAGQHPHRGAFLSSAWTHSTSSDASFYNLGLIYSISSSDQ